MGIQLAQIGGANPSLDFVDDQTSKTLLSLKQHGSVIGDIGTVSTLYDDFLGKAIGATWDVQKGSDAATANFAFNAAVDGTVRATTGAGAGGTYAVNGVQLDHALNWKAANGNLVFEARVKLSAITNISAFIGFTNQLAALQMPANSSGSANGITYNAADCVGFLFDTSMTNANWWAAGQKASTPATAINSQTPPVAATYNRLRIEVDASGNASFYLDNTLVGTVSNAVTATTAMTPVVAVFTRTAASATVDVDYILCQQTR